MGKTKPLAGKIAVVAGATRGAGRGIARGLGEAGATVYCTGRSVRGAPSAYARPETVEETAELVTEAGGVGIAVRVDHAIEEEVSALFATVERQEGRLDVLVNSVAGEDRLLGGWSSLPKTDLSHSEEALRQALLSHVITAKYAATLMIKKRRGLMVEVTEFDLLFHGGNVISGLVKLALKGLAVTLAEEMRKHRIAAIAVTPGFLRSEAMLDHFRVTEANWRDGAKKDKHFLQSETPLFIGRAVAALAQDKNVLDRSGELTSSWELARAYGFTDVDGRCPDWGKYFRKILPTFPGLAKSLDRHVVWLEQMLRRAKGYTGKKPRPAASRRATKRSVKS